jgi:membrane fusion protein, copper/silver efflux system
MNKLKQELRNFKNSTYKWPVVIAIVIGIVIGLFIGGGSSSSSDATHDHGTESASDTNKTQVWTCSMHPQIKQPKPGKCPICGMDLIPISSGDDGDLGPRELKLSASAIQLAEIRVAKVKRRFASSEIRMVGKVEYDETKLGYIASRVPGRIDRLFVDYTGTPVRKGDHLVYLYSPELITAQQELLQSIRTLKKMGSSVSDKFKRTAQRTITAARERLRLWGLTANQIKKIEQKDRTDDHLTIYSPMSGIVIHKNAVEGVYVKTGTRIYTIADLSQVWIKLDAYESDLTWIRYGQTVEFETEAYPGETFKGRIAFIDPFLDAKTRTVKIRVNVSNPDLRLKPQMFVRAVLRSKLSLSGKVMDPELAGKWISPMHPEIVKDRPGSCDVCGMALVKAEKLGYTSVEPESGAAPLVIPASAPLITGTRAVVYIKVKGKEGVFEGREVVLGARAGNFYLVKEGIEEGEEVVVNGAFKIDSDLQIQAKPSMMNPSGGGPTPGHNHGDSSAAKTVKKEETLKKYPITSIEKNTIPATFQAAIDAVAKSYFAAQHALSSDKLEDAKKAGEILINALANVDMGQLKGKAHMIWMDLEKTLKSSGHQLSKSANINDARTQLEILTDPMATAIKLFSSRKDKVFRIHCPMAFNNKGAYWLQPNDQTRNPYFGASMLTCQDSIEPLLSSKKEK